VIGLDTNVLVRFIVRDDEAQARSAARLIESRCTVEDPGWISQVVLCELAWVLGRGYGYDRTTVASVVRRILTVRELRVEAAEAAWKALRHYEAGGAEYADWLIGAANRANLAEATYTFDRRAVDGDLFRLVPG
jgi:predicted nucleic-acid-binding protein